MITRLSYVLILFSMVSFPLRADVVSIEKKIQTFLNNSCVDCHDADEAKAGIELHEFASLTKDTKLKLINMIEEQIYIEEMPMRDSLHEEEKQEIFDLIRNWNQAMGMESVFRGKLKTPAYGNYINHDKLFSGENKQHMAFTPDREWIISEYIFREKVNALVSPGNPERRGKPLPEALSNPFLLSSEAGVRYYANQSLSSSQFVSMQANVPHISAGMIEAARGGGGMPIIKKIIARDDHLNQKLSRREAFLNQFMDKVCETLYSSDNQSWLPKYAPTPLKENRVAKLDEYEKTWSFGLLPAPDGPYIYQTLEILQNNKLSHLELLRACEAYWRNWGVADNVVTRRVETLRKYLPYALENKPNGKSKLPLPKYQALASDEMEIIHKTVKQLRKKGMNYRELVKACMQVWEAEFQAIRNAEPIARQDATTLIKELHAALYQRQPTETELQKCSQLFYLYARDVSKEDAIKRLIEMLLLRTEFVVRNETGSGKMDEHGRRMLSPRDASYAIAYALTDSPPDQELVKAAEEGRLNTREDYRREVTRLLKDRSVSYAVDPALGPANQGMTTMPIRKLRFFREFFGYDNALDVFKDDKRLSEVIGNTRHQLIKEADILVEHILKKDKKVFEELLTTKDFFVLYRHGAGDDYQKAKDQARAFYQHFSKLDWKSLQTKDLAKHHQVLGAKSKNGSKKELDRMLSGIRSFMTSYEPYAKNGKEPPLNFLLANAGVLRATVKEIGKLQGMMQGKNLIRYYIQDPEKWVFEPAQPARLENRMGVLTHPAWLQAFSQNTHTDPVTRGKWVRTKLLAGTIPEIPIGVEAVIPEDHTKTLRDRLAMVTETKQCWRCHKYMNPLGNAFELYDDFGRYRTEEELEHPENILNPIDRSKDGNTHKPSYHLKVIRYRYVYKTAPLDSSGEIGLTLEESLHGKVRDAHEMLGKFADSDLVRQSIIRHAFRYFMGRNEMLSDSKTLMDADEAYLKSGGSFDAVILSLLTSDSFIYRKSTHQKS